MLSPLKPVLRKCVAEVSYRSGLIDFLKKRNSSSWTVLMYHRIVNPEDCSYPLQDGMYVRPDSFEKQMRLLADTANVVSLSGLLKSVLAGENVPAGTLAITFDDGWYDNYEFAFPILKQFKVPATIFLATEYIGTKRLFWTDELALYLRSLCGEDPLGIDLESLRKDLSESILSIIQSKTDFQSGLEYLVLELKKMSHTERADLLALLVSCCKDLACCLPNRTFLSWEEVQEMSSDGIEFASHSHAHLMLAKQTPAMVEGDIECSFKKFEENAVSYSPVFCYPEGSYSSATQQVLRKFGVSAAVTTKRSNQLKEEPILIGRTGIHEDISSSPALFAFRVWV